MAKDQWILEDEEDEEDGRGDPMAQLGNWTRKQRKSSQKLLQRAGYLSGNYVPTGTLDQEFVSAWGKYMNQREAGLTVPLTAGTIGEFETTERVDPMAQLGKWSSEQRQSSQGLLQRAGYLPANYVPTGSLDQKFVKAWGSYMNDREAGLGTPLTAETVGMFETIKRDKVAAPTFGIGALESPTRQDLRDRMIGLYEQWTGAEADRPSLDWVTSMALGKQSVFDIRANVEATPEFRSRFKHMPAGMDIQTYDGAKVSVNALALEHAGREVNDQELQQWFAGDGEAVFNSFMGEG